MSPKTIGPYQIVGLVGQGAFGAVYDATRPETGQRVALKLLHGARALEPEVQNRFVREIAILQRLDHENIVRHYDCGLHEGDIYCAMELVDSGTLKDVLLARGSLPWRESAEVALQICQALAHAHQNGCVHRDLKPANIYLASDGNVKLGDLGLARDLGDDRLTIDGQTVGTWRYMAPEQITGQENIDGRLDIYALGCLLFEMLVGRVPFDGPDFAAIFDQHFETTAQRVDTLVSGVPRELAELVAWMLEKSPADRPADATVVCDRLQAILAGTTVQEEVSTDASSGESGVFMRRENLTERLRRGTQVGERKVNPRALAVTGVVVTILVIVVVIAARMAP
jgi:serine/threonine protein kinase